VRKKNRNQDTIPEEDSRHESGKPYDDKKQVDKSLLKEINDKLTRSQKIQILEELKAQLVRQKQEQSMSFYGGRLSAIEPSDYYMHDVKKFVENKRKADTVACYLDNSRSWSKSKFLNTAHKFNPITSREGRKLNLAEYN